MKFLLQVTRNHVRAFDALLDYYEDMGDQLEVLAHHQSFFESKENEHLNAVLEMIFRDILEFHAKALSYFRQKSKHHAHPPFGIPQAEHSLQDGGPCSMSPGTRSVLVSPSQ